MLRIKKISKLLLCVGVLLLISSCSLQKNFVFFENKLSKTYQYQFKTHFLEYNIPVEKNIAINALLFPVQNSQGLIFYIHGNAGSLNNWGEMSAFYNALGYDFFVFDYRGFGKSGGKILSDKQLFDDNQKIFEFILKKYPADKKVILVGYSIGGSMAAKLAEHNNRINSLVLIAPFYNFQYIAQSFLPFLKNGFLSSFLNFRLETNQYLKNVTVPTYIFHGKKDTLIPFKNSIMLAKEFKNNTKLFLLDNLDHTSILSAPIFYEKFKTILN